MSPRDMASNILALKQAFEGTSVPAITLPSREYADKGSISLVSWRPKLVQIILGNKEGGGLGISLVVIVAG